jgi:hypothetical protein
MLIKFEWKVSMMRMPVAVAEQQSIKDAVRTLEAELKPDVVRIRYDIEEDWTGDWSISFRVLLSDSASEWRRLKRVTRKVRDLLRERIQPRELGLILYCSFRSESEQAELRDPAWK